MSDLLLRIYHRLPPPVSSLAASLRGEYLRRMRYDSHTDALVEQALERELWQAEKWRAWREDRLGFVLHRAATRVPFYRDQWAERRRRGDRASWEVLEHWPILSKETLRANPRAFVADECDTRRMVRDNTSGTTGTSLSIWMSRQTVREWYALFEARWRRWYSVTRHDRWAIAGGQLVTAVARRRPPFWVWNSALNQLYLSSYHLAPQHISSCLAALSRYRVRYLLGYSSSLYALAQGALRDGRRDIRLDVVITNAEPVYAHQREAIEQAFQCPVRETYGMSESVAAAGECNSGRLHLWPEVGIVESCTGTEPTPAGATGDLVCTGVLNADMPLVRYRVGDRGTLSTDVDPCSCGRTLPALAGIEGRIDDVLYTMDGRHVGRLDPVFKGGLPVREAQIIQETLDTVRVRYVAASNFTSADGRQITQRVQARMGAVRVLLEEVDEIPRTSRGKFRAVVCALPPEVRRQLAGIS